MNCKDLCFSYGDTQVLEGVTASFPLGQITAVLGPNGCGKTTLLSLLCGKLTPNKGSVTLNGIHVGDMENKDRAKSIALSPQRKTVGNLSAGALVLHGRFPYTNFLCTYSQRDRDLCDKALQQVGALHLKNQNILKMSGGQRQLVYLAMALAQDTPYILLDEPTTYLDIGHQISFFKQLQQLAHEGKGIILVTHELSLGLSFASQVLVLKDGVLLCAGTPSQAVNSGAIKQAFDVDVSNTGQQFLIQL